MAYIFCWATSPWSEDKSLYTKLSMRIFIFNAENYKDHKWVQAGVLTLGVKLEKTRIAIHCWKTPKTAKSAQTGDHMLLYIKEISYLHMKSNFF